MEAEPRTLRGRRATEPAQPEEGPSSLRVIPWPDPVIDSLGHDPRSWYVEHFWLPIVGPTGVWLMRRLASDLEVRPQGFDLRLEETARALGVGTRRGRHSPLGRAIVRCAQFELAASWGNVLAVRSRMPPLPIRHLMRLPPSLRQMHEAWNDAKRSMSTISEQRRRSRALALELVANGDDLETVELRLMRWGVHPSLAAESGGWAHRIWLSSRQAGGVPSSEITEQDEITPRRA
jgi:hypothetical protein